VSNITFLSQYEARKKRIILLSVKVLQLSCGDFSEIKIKKLKVAEGD
jgi:hypothetical protein